jgi:hypothetical protein
METAKNWVVAHPMAAWLIAAFAVAQAPTSLVSTTAVIACAWKASQARHSARATS